MKKVKPNLNYLQGYLLLKQTKHIESFLIVIKKTMPHNFRTMYNSLTPSLRKSDEPYTLKDQYVAFPPPPPRIPAHPPRLLAEFPPPVPPPFVPPAIPTPLPPVFAPDSNLAEQRSALAWNTLNQNLLFQKQKLNELETKFALWRDSREAVVETRPKRAYTEGEIPPPEHNCRLLYAKLIRHQSQKRQLVQSITQLETYISQQSPHERGFDFNLDKCLDNASRKLKKNKNILNKTEIQIAVLEEQLPSDIVFPLHRSPVPPAISYSTSTKKKRSSKKTPRLFVFKKRSKTWPFS